jgi:hypothetical protein
MDINGAWHGEYTYEVEEGQETELKGVIGSVVAFTLQLKQGWLGSVSGTVQDDARTGFPEQGTIKGKLKGDVLTFTRQMPVLRLMHEVGRLTLEQWAERRKMVIDVTKPHPPIRFSGDISEDGQTIDGLWRSGDAAIEIPGSYQMLRLPQMGGTWKVTRKK